MQGGVRRACALSLIPAVVVSCTSLLIPTALPTATQTLTPPRRPPLTPSPPPPGPTATPRPRGAVCQFPVDYDRDGKLESAGMYRFFWRGEPVEVSTGAGKITVSASPAGNPPSGYRDLILIFDGPLPESLELILDLPVEGRVVYDPAALSVEYRDGSGRLLLQRLTDPRADGLFAINQDIVAVERSFGPKDTFTISLVLRGKRGIRLEARYEAWQLFLGDHLYEYEVLRNGSEVSLHSLGQAPLGPYDGPVSFDGLQLSYAFAEGAGLPFSAASYRTTVKGDVTARFPAPELEGLYLTAYVACGE